MEATTAYPATGFETKEDWMSFFSSCSEEELQGIALVRVVECTNGCIQHAFRDNHPKALPIETTREAMKYSMSLMKSYDLNLPGVELSFSENTLAVLRTIRGLYVLGFKKGDEEALKNFFLASEACAEVVGLGRITAAAEVVRSQLPGIFPLHTVDWGVAYLKSMLKS